MATKQANRIKATCWTPTMRIDLDGSIVGVIESLLWQVKGKAQRKYMADKLSEIDGEMTASEESAEAAKKIAEAEPA